VNYAFRSRDPVTALTRPPRLVWRRRALHLLGRPSGKVIKLWSPAAFLLTLSILSPPSSFLAMSHASGLGRAPLPPPGPSPAGPRPHRKIRRSQSEECPPPRLLVVICSRSRQHSFVSCLAMGLPSVVAKDVADMMLPDFLARQLS
jgi:hypothetical protein